MSYVLFINSNTVCSQYSRITHTHTHSNVINLLPIYVISRANYLSINIIHIISIVFTNNLLYGVILIITVFTTASHIVYPFMVKQSIPIIGNQSKMFILPESCTTPYNICVNI